MKKLNLLLRISLIFTLFPFIVNNLHAQSPSKMSYQAVIRNGDDQLVKNTQVGIKISILKGSTDGMVVYSEVKTPMTNVNGLISVEIGGEAGFNTIDWGNDIYFIKTEADPAGGTDYTIIGTSQMLSVPYALHAKTAESVAGTPAAEPQFYVGQDTLGGIVYYVYRDRYGAQHGLVVSRSEGEAIWQETSSLTNADRSWDGAYNTSLLASSPAAQYAAQLSEGGYDDWYLPSIDELSLLWHARFHINKVLSEGGDPTLSSDNYWSSTEYISQAAFYFFFYGGRAYYTYDNKQDTHAVRAIRSF